MTKSRTSRATRAKVLGGKFSALPPPPPAAAAADADEEERERVDDDSNDGLAADPERDEVREEEEVVLPKRDPVVEDVMDMEDDAILEDAALDEED